MRNEKCGTTVTAAIMPRYVRFVAQCCRPHFRCSWLHWCTPGWTMGTACWSTFRLTWRVNSSRSWMWRLDWSTAWGPTTTYLILSSVCAGCGFLNKFSTNRLFWHTRFYVAMHHVTLVRWLVSATCPIDEHFVLLMPMPTTLCTTCQQSAAEPLRWRLHTSGIHCQLTLLRQLRCPPSIDW